MSCTPEEIEKKRKLALEKLQLKKLKLSSPIKQNPKTTTENILQPLQQTNVNQFSRSTSGNFNSKQQVSSPSVNKPNTSYNNGVFSFTGKSEIKASNFGKYNGICSIINKSSANSVPSSPNSVQLPANSHISSTKTNLSSSLGTNQGINTQKFFGENITGSCCMISDSRFEIKIKYHEQVIRIFKSIPSAIYNAENKLWNFSMNDYNSLILKLAPLQPHITIEKIPKYVLNLLNKKEQNVDINVDRIESELFNILMPFQKEGVLFAIRNNGKCLIADEMGLGKTLQALAIASYYKDDWPLLIVTTSSMKNTWEESIHKFLPSVPLAYIRYMSSGKDYINDAQILIVSYDLMARSTDALIERRFGVLIMDESHIIKNFKAKCTKSAMTLAKGMRRVILLTGTPALSRPSEIYSQLSLIDEKFFGNFFEFSKRYCEGQTTRFGWDASGKSNLTELEIVLKKKFMIRRTKSEVLNVLPSKSREVIKLDVKLNNLSETDRLCLETLVDNYTSSRKGQEKHCILLQLFSESARIKIPSVCLYIENLLKCNEKFLVFAHHQVMLDAICKLLNKNKIDFIRIDGSTNSDQRKYFINKFQLNDSCIAAVLSITATNAGITLTAAQLVLFAELHWNPSILSQAESRAHRIGQQNDVVVRYLLASGTVDDHIWPMLQSKQNVLNEAGLNIDSFKDTAVSDQVTSSPSNLTRAGTKSIADFFQKSPSKEKDQSIQDFMSNEDDDFFVNADIDF